MVKNRLTITVLTLAVIIGGVVWYAQSALINRYNAVIAMSTATKQFPDNNDDVISSTAMQSHSKDQETAAPSHIDTPSSDNAQNHNATTTDAAIRYNADGSIDTSNWQEYCNQEYGFCVKYPEGWAVENISQKLDASTTIIAHIKDTHLTTVSNIAVISSEVPFDDFVDYEKARDSKRNAAAGDLFRSASQWQKVPVFTEGQTNTHGFVVERESAPIGISIEFYALLHKGSILYVYGNDSNYMNAMHTYVRLR